MTGNSRALRPADLYQPRAVRAPATGLRAEVHRAQATAQCRGRAQLTWCFEDRLTVQYQIQEMLRTERIFEPGGIAGGARRLQSADSGRQNLKATLLIEYTDPAERGWRSRACGAGAGCWIAGGAERFVGIADEDLERENDDKTSAVHFLRFELSPAACSALRAGALLELGTDHDAYRHQVMASAAASRALAADIA